MHRIICGLRGELVLKLALVLLLAFTVVGPVYGSQIAFEFDSAPTSLENSASLGFQFTTSAALAVTGLGYYDDGGDGLLTAHRVGIFDASGTLIVAATVSAGTVNPLVGHFRYVSIAPFYIGGSSTFTVAATTGGMFDPVAFGLNTVPGFVVDPLISIAADASRFVFPGDNNLVYPTGIGAYTFYGGPDFQFGLAPEPGTFALLGLVIVPMAILSRSSRLRRFTARMR